MQNEHVAAPRHIYSSLHADAVPVAPSLDALAPLSDALAPSADALAPLTDAAALAADVAPSADSLAPLSDATRPSGHLVHAPCSDYIRAARMESVSLRLPRGQQTGAYAQRP
jgi:hypothetical protein